MATVKLSLNIPLDTLRSLKELAGQRGNTITEVLRQSIVTEQFLDEQARNDVKILVEDASGKKTRLVFRSTI